MKFSELFCLKRKQLRQIYCQKCSKLSESHAGACGHIDEEILIVDFQGSSLDVEARLAKENAFSVFNILSDPEIVLAQLQEFRLSFIGTAHQWICYQPNPWGKDFKAWKGCSKSFPNLVKLSLNASDARISDCIGEIFTGFDDWQYSNLQELEVDLFSVAIGPEQLSEILLNISKIKTLKRLSFNIGKQPRTIFIEEVIQVLEGLFQSLSQLEHIYLNLSSIPQFSENNGYLQRIFTAISSLKNLSSLKLSLKNNKLSPISMTLMSQFLQSLSAQLDSVELDISYNPTIGEKMTESLCHALQQFQQLKSLAINIKGSDDNFTKADYFLLMNLVNHVFQVSIQRFKSSQSIIDSKVDNISLQFPLSFIRQNLALYTGNNHLISLMVTYGPFLFNRLKQSSYSNFFRKEILAEMFAQFLS